MNSEKLEIRLLSMDKGNFGDKSILEVQKEYFLDSFIHKNNEKFYDTRNRLTTGKGSLVLFQYDNHIIASAIIIDKEDFSNNPVEGKYKIAYVFEKDSIRVFEPITKEEISLIDSSVKTLSRAGKKIIDYKYIDKINNLIEEKTKLWKDDNSVLGCDIEDETYEDLSEDELGKKLREYYDSTDFGKVTGIYLFGIKYGKLIKSKNYSENGIVIKSGINESYYTELNKAINLSKYATILDKNNNNVAVKNIDNSSRIKNAFNIIYYGTPGCGKSYLVNMDYDENEYLVYRTTFHPEYSNTDFVGQIIPKTVKNEIKYEFQEGPFAIALLNAIINPSKKVCLIIEEINRGNASAIFGDIFQLLDRNTDGESIYSIVNESIKDYLANNDVHVDKIKIPSNLWIVATMNTSDQNVFTLDTAFKRRWRMHRIRNEFDDSNPYDKKLRKMYVPGSSYTWKQFLTTINKEIMKKNPTGLNSEDKQLGKYFVSEDELSINAVDNNKEAINKFVEKVLLYIWDDVAKIDPSMWFGDDIKSFDDLVKEYYKKNLKVFRDMFIDQNNNESQSVGSDEESN